MQDIIYKGKKAMLLDTPDICEIDVRSKTGLNLVNALETLRVDGYEYLLVLTDLPVGHIPKRLREILSESRNIYVGSFGLQDTSQEKQGEK